MSLAIWTASRAPLRHLAIIWKLLFQTLGLPRHGFPFIRQFEKNFFLLAGCRCLRKRQAFRGVSFTFFGTNYRVTGAHLRKFPILSAELPFSLRSTVRADATFSYSAFRSRPRSVANRRASASRGSHAPERSAMRLPRPTGRAGAVTDRTDYIELACAPVGGANLVRQHSAQPKVLQHSIVRNCHW